jgi:hypothetical protein
MHCRKEETYYIVESFCIENLRTIEGKSKYIEVGEWILLLDWIQSKIDA